MQPLRSISSIKRLKQLVNTLIKALPLFSKFSIALVFIFLVFGVFGLHVFSDSFHSRCRSDPEPLYNNETKSYFWPLDTRYTDRLCSIEGTSGFFKCPNDSYCGNPSMFPTKLAFADDKFPNDKDIFYGVTTFDNIGSSLLTVFQVITGENWAVIMYKLMDAENFYLVALYFSFLVISGTFFLVNIVLPVIFDTYVKISHEDLQKDTVDITKVKFFARVLDKFRPTFSPNQSAMSPKSIDNILVKPPLKTIKQLYSNNLEVPVNPIYRPSQSGDESSQKNSTLIRQVALKKRRMKKSKAVLGGINNQIGKNIKIENVKKKNRKHQDPPELIEDVFQDPNTSVVIEAKTQKNMIQ